MATVYEVMNALRATPASYTVSVANTFTPVHTYLNELKDECWLSATFTFLTCTVGELINELDKCPGHFKLRTVIMIDSRVRQASVLNSTVIDHDNKNVVLQTLAD